MTIKEVEIVNEIPSPLTDIQVLNFLSDKKINWKHVNAIKKLTGYNDDIISDWLSISPKTLRSYRQPANNFKDNLKEQVLLLLALVKHGIEVFGSAVDFEKWLNTKNFYFENKNPVSFLKTITGLRFVDERLTAIQYGDNV